MGLHRVVAATALAAGLPFAAAAQDAPPLTTPPPVQQTASVAGLRATGSSRWVASGFVGSNFGAGTSGTSLDFGGSLAYMWRNWVGGEFLAGFAPDFERQNAAVLLGNKPQVNSYMANAVGSVPLGVDGRWQPFVSGGLGAITLRSDMLSGTASDVNATFNPDDTKFGGNIGGGVMGFVGTWGVRADVRYYRAFRTGDTTPSSPANAIASGLLSGLDFWRANLGIAVRW